MNSDRRSFLGLLGAAAAGAVSPSLEAAAQAAFRDAGETDGLAAANQVRRLSYSDNHPFFSAPASVDVTSVVSLPDAIERPHKRYLIGMASGPGQNDSYWNSELQGSNPNFKDTSYDAVLHPRDAQAQATDPVSAPVPVFQGHPIRISDPLKTLFNASGAAWLEIRSEDPLNFSSAYTFNQAKDGTQQGLGLKVFDAATIMQDERLAHAGDKVTFELYGAPVGESMKKRENWLLFVPPESGDAVLEYSVMGSNGQTLRMDSVEVAKGTFKQINNLQQILGVEVRPGNRLETRIRSKDGSDVAVYQVITKVDNIDPLKQDPIGDEGQMDRLFETAELSVSGGEVIDPYVISARIKTRGDAIVKEVYFDLDGNGEAENASQYRDVNTKDFKRETIAQHPGAGSWTPRMRAFFSRPGFGDFSRDFNGKPYTVTTEQRLNVPMSEYRSVLGQNIDALASHLGQFGFYPDGDNRETWYHKTAATWKTAIAAQLNNISSVDWWDDNNTIIFNDWLQSGNKFQVFIQGPESAMKRTYDLLTKPQ